jgi:hypothetical protein
MRNLIHAKNNNRLKLPPAFDSGVISEPLLCFGGHHEHIDPKTGLALYGPYTTTDQTVPPLRSIKLGIIGTPSMIADATLWLRAFKTRLVNDGSQPFLYPHFPGFNDNLPFCCELMFGETWQESILDREVGAALEPTNFFARISKVVELYTNKIEILAQRDPQPNVILCCIPQEVIDHCTTYLNKAREEKRIKIPQSERRALRTAEKRQTFLFPWMDPTLGLEGEEFGHENLRRGIKARAMPFGIPTQLMWPKTFQLLPSESRKKSERSVQDIATRAWNFGVALYHKAGATPWRLSQIDPGICFVGVSFYREIGSGDCKLRTSLAQMFTAAGDGYVLRGKTFEWDRSGLSPHLDESSAAALIKDVLQLYQRHNRDSLPARIVVHKSSRFWEDELRGFQSACIFQGKILLLSAPVVFSFIEVVITHPCEEHS